MLNRLMNSMLVLVLSTSAVFAGTITIEYRCKNKPDYSAVVYDSFTGMKSGILYTSFDPPFENAEQDEEFTFLFWSKLPGDSSFSTDANHTFTLETDRTEYTVTAWYDCRVPGEGGDGQSGPPRIEVSAFDLVTNEFIEDPEVNRTLESTTHTDHLSQCSTTPCSLVFDDNTTPLTHIRAESLMFVAVGPGGQVHTSESSRQFVGWVLDYSSEYATEEIAVGPNNGSAIAMYTYFEAADPLVVVDLPFVPKRPGNGAYLPEICKYVIDCPGCGNDPFALCLLDILFENPLPGSSAYLVDDTTRRPVQILNAGKVGFGGEISPSLLRKVGGIENLGLIIVVGKNELRSDAHFKINLTREPCERSAH